MKRNSRGSSLVEAVVVVGLIMIASAVALVQMRQSVKTLDADKASDLVRDQLRYARQVAVDQRRNVRVDFVGSSEIKVSRIDDGRVTPPLETVMSDVFLPNGFTFATPGGVSNTPLGGAITAPVDFNKATTGIFLADGTFVDPANYALSGIVFTLGGGNGTARAVTLTGASGRTTVYWLQGTTWQQR